MQNKSLLLEQIDNLINNHGKNNPELLRDLQSHRSAIANAFSKKDLADAAYKIANICKMIYDIFNKD